MTNTNSSNIVRGARMDSFDDTKDEYFDYRVADTWDLHRVVDLEVMNSLEALEWLGAHKFTSLDDFTAHDLVKFDDFLADNYYSASELLYMLQYALDSLYE